MANQRNPPPEPTNWTGFPRRLGFYLGGLAIGLMVLGFFHMAKKHEAEVQAQRAKELEALPKPKDDFFPPPPGFSNSSNQPPAPGPAPSLAPGPVVK